MCYDRWMMEDRLCNMVDFVNISDSTLRVRDVWRSGKWHFNELSTIITPELWNKINAVPVFLNENVED